MFDPATLRGTPLHFAPRKRTTSDYPGYYHWHQCCEALFIHEGEGFVIVDQQTYEMRPGTLFVFQPYQLHKVYANVSERTPYERTLIYFDPLFFDQELQPFRERHAILLHLWKDRLPSAAFSFGSEADYVERILERYERRTRENTRDPGEEEMTMLLLQLLDAMPREAIAGDADEPSRRFRPLSHAENAMAWIESHYAEDFHLDDLADALHLSKFYLSRLFLRETGSSLSDYVIARRIKQACRLLDTTELAVERIASEVGYPNASYFIRVFKQVMGTTPLRFRIASRHAYESHV